MKVLSGYVISVFLLSCLVSLSFAGDLPSDYVRQGEKVLVTLEETINPRHTALVIVDVQNDFVYGKGKLSTPAGKTNPCEEILSPLNAFIEKCRKLGVPVLYTYTVHAGDLDLPPYKARMIRRQTAPVCMRGSKGAEFPDKLNKPLPNEPVVIKHGFDAFADGDLNTLLQNRGIKSIIFSGIDSAVCVDTTLRHGFHLGYYVVLAKDLSASPQPARQECAINLIGSQYGFVSTSKEIMQLWDKAK
ncbi:MAG: cysteine hydrolase family protein [Deltaproteobacteria bacterium]|nr:cysteine hydrolase family protein [Deltaproteobacteria bacterium]